MFCVGCYNMCLSIYYFIDIYKIHKVHICVFSDIYTGYRYVQITCYYIFIITEMMADGDINNP